MNTIPSSKVLDKISELAVQAKAAQTKEQQLGYILAVKTLCELLEQESMVIGDPEETTLPVTAHVAVSAVEQKVRFEDANGTSLLDF